MKTPETDYEQVIAHSTEYCSAKSDWDLTAHFAFTLADDRPKLHDLQPLAVLNAAEAAGENVAEKLPFVPLTIDSPPSSVACWRAKRSYFLYLVYCEIGIIDVGATAIAVARHYREPAMPALEWLMDYATMARRQNNHGRQEANSGKLVCACAAMTERCISNAHSTRRLQMRFPF